MNSENREEFNEIGFKRAQESLSSKEGLLKMQTLANRIVRTKIGLTYSKVYGLKHNFCFIVYPKTEEEIPRSKISELFMAIAQELLYSDILVVKYGTFSKPDFDTRYVEPVEIFPENLEAVRALLRRHCLYLGIDVSDTKKEESYGGRFFAEEPVVRNENENLEVKSASSDQEEKQSEGKRSRYSRSDDLSPASSGETTSPPKKKIN